MFDMEDIGARRPLAPKNVTVTVAGKRKLAEGKQDLGKSWREALGPPPKRSNGLKEWIKFQKKKWQFQAAQRKAGECGKRSRVGVSRQAPITLGGFLRQTKRTLLDTPWQVIQVAETPSPGFYKVWALVGADLHCVKMIVPRTFYVNQRTSKEATEGGLWRKVNKLLPRSQVAHCLYEYSVPEGVFRQHEAQLMADLSTPDIQAIYELQLPLEFRAVEKLGCLVSVEKSKAKQLQGRDTDTFELSWMQFKSLASYHYLEPGSFKYIYLYHHRQGSKAMWGLMIPGTKRATVWVVDTVRSKQLPSLPTLFNNERSAYMAKQDRPEGEVPGADHTWDVRLETEERQVGKQVGRLLAAYLQEKRGPTILATQSPYLPHQLTSIVPQSADMPVVPLHLADSDSLYSVLDWQRKGAVVMMRHYLKSDCYLASTLEHCRYFHVPAGNLPRDTTVFGADLFFARHLRKQNFVLWGSPTDRPDLGGKEADDARLLTEQDDGLSVTINVPDMYRSVCVELDIDALAVNTLLQAHAVQELEGTAGAVAFDAAPQTSLEELASGGGGGGLASYDETALTAPAFRVLRAMVAAWLRDVSMYKNIYADYQIVHFYRWLRSPSSLLYDPALKKTLLQLMKKLFLQLVAEFRRLGAVVVYADFNKIILNTKKRTVRDAVSYVKYVTDNIKNKEIFHSIEMTIVQSWDILLWCDSSNFGGIRSDMKELEEKEEDEDLNDEEEEEDAPPEVSMAWNLADYLPEAGNVRGNFQRVVVGYISALHHFLQEELERVAPGATPIRKRKISQPTNSQKAKEGAQTAGEFCAELVGGELSQRLFGVVEKLNKKFPMVKGREEEEEGSIFPTLPGSHLHLTFPALEFVKAICKVLGLDPAIEAEVRKMRRNLLKLINVGEFDQVFLSDYMYDQSFIFFARLRSGWIRVYPTSSRK